MARTSACDSIPNSLDVRPLALYGIEGLLDRRNDALFRPALPRLNSDPNFVQKTLVFFGGDIQNFIYLMDQNDPNILYQRWCLETTATRLGASFPSHHIVVIKPSRIVFEHISCFDNFVESNYLGMPKHTYCYRGLVHLESILMKISRKIRLTPSDELFKMLLKVQEEEEDFLDDNSTEDIVWQYELMTAKKRESLFRWQKALRLNKYPITLVAFSKGCVVLNQFLYEYHYSKRLEPNNQDSSFVDCIEAMYWLDAGHPGQNNVYPTSRGMLKTLTDLGIEVHVHSSQYQTEDFIRPWIRRQWLEFLEMLKSLKAKLVVHRHQSESTDLRSHFNVLYSFKEIPRETSLLVSVPPPAPPISQPSLPLPLSESPPPPEQTPRERAMMHKEILGISLVTPNWTPYLGLQLVLRRPLSEIMARLALRNSFSDTQSSSDSESQDGSDGEVPSPDAQSPTPAAQRSAAQTLSSYHTFQSSSSSSSSSTSAAHSLSPSTAQNRFIAATRGPYTFDAQPSATAGESPFGYGTQNTSDSANQPSTSGTQNRSNSTAQPSTSGTQSLASTSEPSTSGNQNRSNSTAQPSTSGTQSLSSTSEPSTSGTQNRSNSTAQPSTSGNQNRSNSTAQPSTSGTQSLASTSEPSTSGTQNRSNSTAQPSTSGNQNRSNSTAQPSTSGTQSLASTSEPSTSGNQNRSNSAAQPSPDAQKRPSANSFQVLISKESSRINFSEDHEAAEAYRTAKYFKLESPVIATPTEWPAQTGLNIYTPVNDNYAPLVLNPARPSSGSLDSAAAATPRPAEAAPHPGPGPAMDNPMNNLRAASPAVVAPNNASQAARDFSAAQPSNSSQNAPRPAQSDTSQGAPSLATNVRVSQSTRPDPSSTSNSSSDVDSSTSRTTGMDVDSTDSSESDTPQASAPVVRRIIRSRRRRNGGDNRSVTRRYNLRFSR